MKHKPSPPASVIPVTVQQIQPLSANIRAFTFSVDDPRWGFQAGQWVDLYLHMDGEWRVGGYSMTTSPLQHGQFDLVLRAAQRHPVTRYMHEQLRVGDQLLVSAGQGDFAYDGHPSDGLLLMAVGIGITPLLSILRDVVQRFPGLPLTLVHASSEKTDFIYAEELRAYAAQGLLQYRPLLTQAESDWFGDVGYLDEAFLREYPLTPETDVYFCGTRDFVESMAEILERMGVLPERLHYERWW